MPKVIHLVVLCLVVSAGVNFCEGIDWDDESTISPSEISTKKTTTTTTTIPTTITTPSTTMAPPTTSTTTKPTTEPTTTTVVPTTPSTVPTTTVPTTTTTALTTTTTAATTTTTPKPKPTPTPGVWSVTDEVTNVTCIVLKLSASFVVPYKTFDNQSMNATLTMPSNASSTGYCGLLDEDQSITLSWDTEDKVNNMKLTFHRTEKEVNNKTVHQFTVSSLSVELYADSEHFPNSTTAGKFIEGKSLNASLFQTNVNNSYRCNADQEVPISETVEVASFVHLSHVQVEAFRSQTDQKFNSAVDCSADGILTSDIVPIAVGCALAALVVVVLIAYLIGRRRARQRGYQSV